MYQNNLEKMSLSCNALYEEMDQLKQDHEAETTRLREETTRMRDEHGRVLQSMNDEKQQLKARG